MTPFSLLDVLLTTSKSTPPSPTLLTIPAFKTTSTLWHGHLQISHSKCNVFEIGKRFQPLNNHTFHISSIPLISLQSTSDLDIIIDKTITLYLSIIIYKSLFSEWANALISYTDISSPKMQTHFFVQSLCSPLAQMHYPAWSSHEIGLLNSIEAVQRSSTKRISGLRDTSYADRLSLLGFQSLEHCRLISDLATSFNIVHGHCSITWIYSLLHLLTQPILQRPLLTLILSTCQNQFCKVHFLQSCCPTMELPASWCCKTHKRALTK